MRTPSRTYKLRIPGEDEQVVYFTILGDHTPEAFFINSKSMGNFQWITALMTAYSRQLKSTGDINGIISDMKNTFDPQGKYIIPDGTGREANSIVHHLGLVLEKHMDELKDRTELLELYEAARSTGLNHLDASTYAEETLQLSKGKYA